MIVRPETALVRPFIVCAVLRGITFDQQRYNSFIDLQVLLTCFNVSKSSCRELDVLTCPLYEIPPIEDCVAVKIAQQSRIVSR